MAPSTGPAPLNWPLAARVWRYRRALIVGAALAVAYLFLHRWMEDHEARYGIAASDPHLFPETRWRLLDEPLPEGAAGIYYVPGVGILPVASTARWTDGIRGCLDVLLEDRLNTWSASVGTVDLFGLPPFQFLTLEEPSLLLVLENERRDAVELRSDDGGWQHDESPRSGRYGGYATLPAHANVIKARFHDHGTTTDSIDLTIRSPERSNAVRAEPSTVLAARSGVTIAVAAVAAWPGGTAIRLEGWTDDPRDVVLLGLDADPGFAENNDALVADPNGAVVLRDGSGRMLPLRNAGRLADRRDAWRWADWLGDGLNLKPGIDLPATFLFDALPADAKALTLSVGPIRIAHDMLLPEDADRPAEGEERETLTIPVPDDAPTHVSAHASDEYSGFDAPLADVPLTLAGAHVVARRVRFAPGGDVVIELVNDTAAADRRLVDVFGVPERWRRADEGHRFHRNDAGLIRIDAGARPSVRVAVGGGPRWPDARATAVATAGPDAVPWPPPGARPITVALVRPVVELSGRWTFELPMDVLRANAAVNVGLSDDVD